MAFLKGVTLYLVMGDGGLLHERSDWGDQVDGVIHILDQLFGVGALAHRGLPPFIGGLCGDRSPHRTTMTQTKCCPILHFGLWWLHLPVCTIPLDWFTSWEERWILQHRTLTPVVDISVIRQLHTKQSFVKFQEFLSFQFLDRVVGISVASQRQAAQCLLSRRPEIPQCSY